MTERESKVNTDYFSPKVRHLSLGWVIPKLEKDIGKKKVKNSLTKYVK